MLEYNIQKSKKKFVDIKIDKFEVGEFKLKAKEPVIFRAKLFRGKGYIIQDHTLGIKSAGKDHEYLILDLYYQIHNLWKRYALESDDKLNDHEKQIKAKLLSMFEQSNNH